MTDPQPTETVQQAHEVTVVVRADPGWRFQGEYLIQGDQLALASTAQIATDLETLLGDTKFDAPYEVVGVRAAGEDAKFMSVRDVETDEMDGTDPHYALGSLWGRLEAFLKAQPDVTDLAEAGVPGYYGFRLTAAGDVSLVCQFTSGNTLADGTVA